MAAAIADATRRRAHGSDGPCSFHLGPVPSLTYREYAPPSALRPYLVCAWTLEIGAGTRSLRQRILPDGCADIVWIGGKAPIVVGPMTRSVLATSAAGTTVVGLRFRPEAGARVLGVPGCELTDRHVPLDQLWRSQAVNEISERLLEQRSNVRRVAVAQSLLVSRRDLFAAPDPVVQHALSLIGSVRRVPVETLADEIGISARQLRRRFTASTGYSPKGFQRILRFQRLLAIAKANPSARLDHLALLADYADQAHMTREVGQFASARPTALLGRVVSALALSDLLTSPE